MTPISRKMGILAQVLAGFLTLTLTALPALAQFVPGPYYYYDPAAIATLSSAYQSAAQQKAYNENRQMQMASSMASSRAWRDINNTMQMEAAARSAAIPDTGQSAREWMFQYGGGRPLRKPTTLPASESAAATSKKEPSKPAAAPRDIMLWPTLLKDKRFDDDRSGVEAPFRRAYTDGKPLTIKDYQGIVKSVEKMKAAVRSMESQIVETEFTSVQKFLDDLIADAQKRIRAREALGDKDKGLGDRN